MRRDFDTVRRQYLTAEKALRGLDPESPALPAFQKVYDQAKALYDEHPQNPINIISKKRKNQEKRF